MIRPTLFVGLGTTGTEILKKLRELMSEEYGYAGLPLFRYIAIETDGSVDVQNTNQMKDYERINLISATVKAVSPIRRKLTPGEPLYSQHLEDWLDPELLKIEAGGFTAGASNIRMAGRLCLWENWSKMRGILTKALGAIIAPATTRDTVSILTQRNKNADHLLNESDSIKIYIVGSLCGGSCSGMLIDVAYFLKYQLSAYGDKAKVYGIFTTFDENHAANPDAMYSIRSANCYASLLELNYYHHQDTTYDITFPDKIKIENLREKPFDYTLFVSPSGKIPGNQFVTRGGEFDETGLNLMVALNLFAEASADTGGNKDAIRTNFTSHGDFGTLKPVRQGEIATMIRYMASFGLTAVWYPKYRIASAVACLISNRLCKNWLETHIPQATIVSTANKEWDQILKENIDTLTSPEGLPPIKSQIETHLAKARQQWLNQDISANQLGRNMETFPTGGSFKNKFDQGGEYAELMNMQVLECKKEFRKAIEQILNNQLAKIDFDRTYGLGDVQTFFTALDKEIENTIQQCPDRVPSLDLKKLDFAPMDWAESNRWVKFIFLHERLVEAQRKVLIDQYCGLISGSRTSIYEAVRNYYLRPILQEIREELGFGVQPMTNGIPNPPPTIKQRLDQIVANLNRCIDKFTSDYNDAINPPRSECVEIVTNDPDNQIDTDAEILSHQIAQTNHGIELLRGGTMAEFLVKGQEDITTQMTDIYRQLSLAQIQVDDVITKAQALLNSGSAAIQNLASRSNPYQMFNPGYTPFTVADSPNLIFGHLGKALTALKDNLSGQGYSFGEGLSSVDHLLFFYQEESGFALDDLVSHAMLADKFQQTPGDYGHSTHQDPDFYDLELYHKTQKLQRWCGALGRLVPEICQHINKNAFSGVFYPTKNGYVFEYDVDGLSQRLGLHDDKDRIKRFSQKRNETAYDNFFNAVQSSFTQLDFGQIKVLINKMLRNIEDHNEHALLSKFFGQFLDDVDSKDGFADDADTEAALDLDFFKVIPQTHQDTPTEELDETPSNSYQQVDGESGVNATADTEDYTEVAFEEEDVETTTVQETQVNFGDTPQQDDATDEDDEGFATVETEPSPTDESAEEATPEQQPQPEVAPETGEQKQQTQPTKEFSVADTDVKQLQRRDNTRKKE